MKILRVIARLNVGGPARHTVVLGNGLAAKGADTLLVFGTCGADEASMEHLLDEAAFRSRKIPALGRRVRPWDDLRALAALVRLVFAERPDVIHTHTAKGGALGRLAALIFNLTRRPGRRALVIHTFHGHVLSGYFGPAVNRVVRLIERALARVTDHVVTISPRLKEELVDTFRVSDDEQTFVVPLGLPLEPLLALAPPDPASRAAFGFEPDHLVVAFVGRFVAIKDLPTLVEGFAEAHRAVPRLRLLLVGDGEARPRLEALADHFGLGNDVRFAGWQEDLARVYGAADVVALTSRNEGTPVAIIEAMAAARAVIATRVGGVPDVVRHEANGLTIPPGRPDALADALERLAGDENLRRRLGDAARVDAAARFGAARLVDELDRLYRTGVAAVRAER
jgi:glycosyltransferase involved in cell wall biosynthesis